MYCLLEGGQCKNSKHTRVYFIVSLLRPPGNEAILVLEISTDSCKSLLQVTCNKVRENRSWGDCCAIRISSLYTKRYVLCCFQYTYKFVFLLFNIGQLTLPNAIF